MDPLRLRALDRTAAAVGLPPRVLMEAAGVGLATAIAEAVAPGDRVMLLIGHGNNGGDALAAVRYLDEYELIIHTIGSPSSIASDPARANYDVLAALQVPIDPLYSAASLSVSDVDLVVDAMVGTGLQGPLREPVASVVELVNTADVPVLAVDVPTGHRPETDAGPRVDADHIVSFHASSSDLDGLDVPVTTVPIGIPEELASLAGPGDLLGLQRPATAHKGDAGRVLVIGGGPYTGAPALAAQAALAAGADLSYVLAPASVATTIEQVSPDLIVRSVSGDRFDPSDTDTALELATEMSSVVIGPGIGEAPETQRFVASVLESFDGVVVVDADALGVVPQTTHTGELICTPHQGEFTAMGATAATGWRERREEVLAQADAWGVTLLVKGAVDLISDGTQTRFNTSGNPAMSVGGTGDVLAGITGAFAAVLDPLTAASAASYLNGYAGDRAVESYGIGLTASRLIDAIAPALMEVGP
jgi:yjeF C-terminal region, hydroxyethylthiazole kinase-related/yjeF N-terminal region